MLGYLSADIISRFSKREARGNFELRGTDNVQGQISEHIFALNECNCLYYPSNIFKQVRSNLETFSGNYLMSKQLCKLL